MLATAQVGEVSIVKTHLLLFILDLSSGITSVFANAHSARWTWTLIDWLPMPRQIWDKSAMWTSISNSRLTLQTLINFYLRSQTQTFNWKTSTSERSWVQPEQGRLAILYLPWRLLRRFLWAGSSYWPASSLPTGRYGKPNLIKVVQGTKLKT